MAQPVSGLQSTLISGTAAGTANLLDRNGRFEGVAIGIQKEGTVDFYDNATGTSAASLILTVDQNAVDQPTDINLGVAVRHGLSYAVSGTTELLAVYE